MRHEQPLYHENEPQTDLIADHMERYYETHGTWLEYKVERSIIIEDHEVAWMKITDTRPDSETGRDEPWTAHSLYCACEFTENVGWKEDEKYGTVGLAGKDSCDKKERAVQLRQQELRQEYISREMLREDNDPTAGEVQAIMLDLIEKAKNEEFLEGHNGASFWGGYYYLQTPSAITGVKMREMWDIARELIDEKKIDLEGAVVQEYREPPEPSWETSMTLSVDGWSATACLPTHSKMPQVWKFELKNPEGETVELDPTQMFEQMDYMPTFGPDVSDVQVAQERLEALIKKATGTS